LAVLSISFHATAISFRLRQARQVRQWLLKILHERGFSSSGISYIFCSDEYLLRINQEYLQHHDYTDIITFPYHEPNSKQVAGDIFISIDRVKENAKNYRVTFQQELYRVMAHGCLHVMGWTDATTAEKEAMRVEEDKCLARIDW
jgi:rRNA maturation RNase YbeY